MTIRHPANFLVLVACALLLPGHAAAQEAAEETAEKKTCSSGEHGDVDGNTVCAVETSVEYHPEDGHYAHAIWVLQHADGSPVEEETEVDIATLQWIPTAPPGMPPLDMVYREWVAEDGRVVFHSDWPDRRLSLSFEKFVDDDLEYVGDGDELIIEADR